MTAPGPVRIRRRSTAIAVAAICLLFVNACGSEQAARDPRPVVVVSVAPQAYLIDRLASGRVNVKTMIEVGRSPEDFQPLPQQLAAIDGAQYYFAVGLPFEQIWLPKLAEVHPSTAIVATAADPATAELDPHYWTNPRNAIELVRAAYEPLSKVLPDSDGLLDRNYRNLIDELEILDVRIQTLMDEQVDRRFLVYHPAWSHFAARYGLEQIAVEHDGKQPGARYLNELLALCRANDVQTILVQPQTPPEHVQRFAAELDATQIMVDPLDYDYADNLWAVAQIIARELW